MRDRAGPKSARPWCELEGFIVLGLLACAAACSDARDDLGSTRIAYRLAVVSDRGIEERAVCAPVDAQRFVYRAPSGRATPLAASRVPELELELGRDARAIATRVPASGPSAPQAFVVEIELARASESAARAAAFARERDTCNVSIHAGGRVVGIGELRIGSRLPGGTFATLEALRAALGDIALDADDLDPAQASALALEQAQTEREQLRALACDPSLRAAFERDDPEAFALAREALDRVPCDGKP